MNECLIDVSPVKYSDSFNGHLNSKQVDKLNGSASELLFEPCIFLRQQLVRMTNGRHIATFCLLPMCLLTSAVW